MIQSKIYLPTNNYGLLQCEYIKLDFAFGTDISQQFSFTWEYMKDGASVFMSRYYITNATIITGLNDLSVSDNNGIIIKLVQSTNTYTFGAGENFNVSRGRCLCPCLIEDSQGDCIFRVIDPTYSDSSGIRSYYSFNENGLNSLGYAERIDGYTFTQNIYNPDTQSKTIGNRLKAVAQLPATDPYQGAGDSTTGGGDGTFDGTSDPVPVPSLPSVGAQDSGFITLFAPTAQQMKDLAHYMWVNPLFDLTAFKKIFADPMDCILGLSVVPVSVPTSGAKNVNIGNLVTSVTMNVASQQYIEVDCGTVTMQRFFGSYLDFEPYTKISLFLPYCGTHSLSMDDIAGKTIGIVYHIDILTGSCIAFVKCGDSVLYEFNGACGSNIPVNSLNFASTIENAIRIAVNIGTTVATAGASAPVTAATEGAQAIGKAANVGRAISLAGSTAEGALSLKPNVSRSGALGGGVGILGHQIPYFIITRPRLCKPAKQDFFQGYPSFIQTTIGDLIGKGFTSFTNVIIAGQYLTDEEETELESILESGVYL